MKITNHNKIIGKFLHSFYDDGTLELPKRLREKNSAKSFNDLKNWALVRTFAINNHKLTFDYIHLLEQEKFDEN